MLQKKLKEKKTMQRQIKEQIKIDKMILNNKHNNQQLAVKDFQRSANNVRRPIGDAALANFNHSSLNSRLARN